MHHQTFHECEIDEFAFYFLCPPSFLKLQISSRKVENEIRTLEVNQVVKMHNSGHYCNDDHLSSKKSRAGCARQLTLIWMRGTPLPSLCLPVSSQSPSLRQLTEEELQPQVARTGSDSEFPQGSGEWVVREGWEREFQIRKVAQMGEWPGLEFQK